MIESLLLSNLSWIRAVAGTFCRSRADAEDLAGSTVLKVLLNADRYDESRSFRLWVLVIMRNTFRSGLRRTGTVLPFSDLPEAFSFDDPVECAIRREHMRIVEECASKSVSVRSALLYAEGYSYSEIADMQGVTVNIVKSRVHHGRLQIARKVSECKCQQTLRC